MKKMYNNPEIELCAVNSLDVIASSGDLGKDIGVEADEVFGE